MILWSKYIAILLHLFFKNKPIFSFKGCAFICFCQSGLFILPAADNAAQALQYFARQFRVSKEKISNRLTVSGISKQGGPPSHLERPVLPAI